MVEEELMNDYHPVKVIAVSSGKGGVGKTNVSVNLAVGLSRLGNSVMLMDADLGMANVDIMLGIKPEFDLHHVITGQCTLDEVIISSPLGIDIIPASSGIGHMADLSEIEQASLIRSFSDLDRHVDVLIIDTAAGISKSVIAFSKAVQEIIVVVCDEPASITDAYALIKVLNKEHGVKKFKILSNMVSNAEHGKHLFAKLLNATELFLDVSLRHIGSIPMDEKLRDAVRLQTAVVDSFPASPSSIAFGQVTKRVDETPVVNMTNGYLEFFVERLAGGMSSMEGLH